MKSMQNSALETTPWVICFLKCLKFKDPTFWLPWIIFVKSGLWLFTNKFLKNIIRESCSVVFLRTSTSLHLSINQTCVWFQINYKLLTVQSLLQKAYRRLLTHLETIRINRQISNKELSLIFFPIQVVSSFPTVDPFFSWKQLMLMRVKMARSLTISGQAIVTIYFS